MRKLEPQDAAESGVALDAEGVLVGGVATFFLFDPQVSTMSNYGRERWVLDVAPKTILVSHDNDRTRMAGTSRSIYV